jgi:hypothetical protein
MTEKNKNSGVSTGNGSVVIGGNVQGSNIVIGNNNTVSNQRVNLADFFDTISDVVDKQIELKPNEKNDIKAELQEIHTSLEKPEPDENFITRRFRNIKSMAPEIVEVAFETLKNPVGGVAEVVKRIAKKMSEEANT